MPFMIIISWVLNHLILSSVEFVRFPQDEKRLGTPGGRSLGAASHQHVLSFLGIQNGTVSGIKSHWKGPGEKNNKKTPGNPRHRLNILIQLGFFRWTKVTFFWVDFELVGSLLDFARKFDWCLFRGLEHGKLRCESFDDATKKIHYWLHPFTNEEDWQYRIWKYKHNQTHFPRGSMYICLHLP